MKLTTKQLTLCGILTTLALALSVAENQIPLSLAIPIPGRPDPDGEGRGHPDHRPPHPKLCHGPHGSLARG